MDAKQRRQYCAVRESVGWRELNDRAKAWVKGPDCISFLHSMLASDVQTLSLESGRYGALLTATGKIVADFNYYRFSDQVLLDVAAVRMVPLLEKLESYIIMDDVELQDVSGEFSQFWIQGPKAGQIIEGCFNCDVALEELQVCEHTWQGRPAWVISKSDLGVPGYEALIPSELKMPFLKELSRLGKSQGLEEVSPEVYEVLRIEAGIPLFGVDYSEKNNPIEARLPVYSLTKGCFPGQEVLAKATYIGGVARLLSRLRLEGESVPGRDASVLSEEGKKIGWVTSAAFSPRLGSVVALAYLKRTAAVPDSVCSVEFSDAALCRARVVEEFV